MLTVPVLQNSQSTEYRILLTFSQLKLNVCLLLIVGLLFNDSNYLKLLSVCGNILFISKETCHYTTRLMIYMQTKTLW